MEKKKTKTETGTKKEPKQKREHQKPWMEESLRPSPVVEADAYYVPLVDRQAFARLGFEYRRTATQRGYVAVHRTGVEMEAYRRTLAEKNTAETMTDDSMTAIF